MNLGMKEVINGSTHSLQVSFQVLRFSSVTTILPTVALLLLHATLVRRTSEHLGNYSQSDTLQKNYFLSSQTAAARKRLVEHFPHPEYTD